MNVTLTPEAIEERAAEYREVEPLYTVEQEHLELLPADLAEGDYGWRDVEWIVQWYYRRELGGYPDRERRAGEAAFRENDYEAVREAVAAASEADAAADALEALTALEGVDVPMASALAMFVDPERFLVVSEREWATLRAAGELDEPYPDAPDVADYERCLDAARGVAADCDCDLWTVYRALWRLGGEREE
jgi:hypothetical protein